MWGAANDAVGLAIFSIIVFWLGVVIALIGAVAEGIRVSQQQRDRSP